MVACRSPPKDWREFDSIDGIEIVDYELVSEADFSLVDLHATLRWDYDFLSYMAGTNDDTTPDAA